MSPPTGQPLADNGTSKPAIPSRDASKCGKKWKQRQMQQQRTVLLHYQTEERAIKPAVMAPWALAAVITTSGGARRLLVHLDVS